MKRSARRVLFAASGLVLAVPLLACGRQDLDAGADHPRGLLPVDNRSPIILSNDGPRDNWQGELALLLASRGEIRLAGIVVNSSSAYPVLDDNLGGWRQMIAAARASGLRNIPDPIASVDPTLQRPPSGDVDATQPNDSDGARLIIAAAHRLGRPLRPLVVVTGGRVTEAADAYLLDHGIADRIVVVASLGRSDPAGTSAAMTTPNGIIDPWADEIVARRLRYVQVNAYYDQQADVPAARVAELPANRFGTWMAAKIADILPMRQAADQISVSACAQPDFATAVVRMAESSALPPAVGATPVFSPSVDGNAWIVTAGDNARATDHFWQALTDPATWSR